MKKVLKSILIATASIGAISGSTAAVISCGSNGGESPKSTEQEEYNKQVETIVNYLKTSSAKNNGLTANITSNQSDESIKSLLVLTINRLIDSDPKGFDQISRVTSTSSFTFAAPTTTGGLSASFSRNPTTDILASTGIKVTIPKASTSEATAHDVDMTISYSVTNSEATTGDYNTAVDAIKLFFNGPTQNVLFNTFKGITIDEAINSIRLNIALYVLENLPPVQRQALNIPDISLIDVQTNNNLPNINDATASSTIDYISGGKIDITIPSNVGDSKKITITAPAYKRISEANGLTSRVASKVLEYFKINDIVNAPASTTDFLPAIKDKVTAFLNTLQGDEKSLININATIVSLAVGNGSVGKDKTVGTHFYNGVFDETQTPSIIEITIVPNNDPAPANALVDLLSYQYTLT